MNLVEVTALLTKMAVFDRRTIGESDVRAWHEVLDPDMPLSDALDAVTEHRGQSADWIMPNHINDRVRRIRRDRLRSAGVPDIPSGLTHSQERAWRQLWCQHVKDGHTPDDAVARSNDAMGIVPEELVARPVHQLVASLSKP